MGDSGYADEPDKIVATRPEHPNVFKTFVTRLKSRQETLNAGLKIIRVLISCFHHCMSLASNVCRDDSYHGSIFR